MWYEARKREKATQKLFDDHRKRAEKRREENRVDPHSLLQVNGIKSKLCLDPSVYRQAVKSLVAWQGDKNVSIDRFDVRATLTSIPNEKQPPGKSVLDMNESDTVKCLLGYERFRLLMKNDLNKTPEQLRLKLVSRSQVLSGAHLKKLQYDSFGAYSDIATGKQQQQHPVGFRPNSRSNREPADSRRERAGCYSAVPPPEQLAAKPSSMLGAAGLHQPTPDKSLLQEEPQRFNAAAVVDLDEIEDGDDLDAINAAKYDDSKTMDEVVHRYGLTAREFLLLARRDRDETTLSSSTRELEDLKNELRLSAERHQQEQVYGPTLPPDHHQLESGSPGSPSSSSSSSGDEGAPQRSPSGACIPRRDSSDRISRRRSSDRVSLPEESPPSPPPSQQPEQSPKDLSTGCLRDHIQEPSRKSSSHSPEPRPSRESRKREHSPARGQATDAPLPPRRASTPLAYKRNRRSSRSLSRERRRSSSSSRHRSSRHRSRGHRREESSRSRQRRRRRERSRSSSYSSSSGSTSSSY